MSFFKKLFPPPPPANRGKFYKFAVKCKRCGEIIHGQVNVNNDPSVEYDEKGQPYYVCRKVVIGSDKMCFNQIEAIFKFNVERGLLDRQITGGEFVES